MSTEKQPSHLRSFYLLLRLALKQQWRSWRVIVIAAMVALPILVALLAQLNPNPGQVPPQGQYTYLVNSLYLQFFIWLVPLLYGAITLREKIDSGTLPYLWIRPVSRKNIVLANWLATLVLSLPALLVSEAICFAIYGLTDIYFLLQILAITALGMVYFTSLFQLMGVIFSQPLTVGLLYGVFFEVILASFHGQISKLSILGHLYNLTDYIAPPRSPHAVPRTDDPILDILIIAIATLIALGLALWAIGRIEVGKGARG